MIIKSIELCNFKNYKGKHKFYLSEYNLISGTNGAGKSTLGLDSILFCLYGHSTQHLEKLPTRNTSDVICYVAIEVDNLKVVRKIPTALEIYKDGIKLEFPTNREAQKYLNDLYKGVDYFRKFRMIDITKGINVLEQGNKELLRTLFQYHQEYLNSIRQLLTDKKALRERYNIDSISSYTLAPSQKRFDFLSNKIKEIDLGKKELAVERNKALSSFYSLTSQKKQKETEQANLTTQKTKVTTSSTCPLCKSILTNKEKTQVNHTIKEQVNKLQNECSFLIEKINSISKTVKQLETKELHCSKRYEKILILKQKLETRLKQKDYIYTTKDVEILKTAIKELDKFSSSYIVKYIGSLEPIINDVLKIIGFEVKFTISKKGDISIELLKDNIIFDYFDLSSGQKLLLTVGFQLALLLEKGEEGIIIADEGFSSLTEENLTLLLDMIKQYPFQLIYVIHRIGSLPEGVKEIKL